MAAPDYVPASNPFSAADDFPSTAVGVTLPGGVSAVYCDYPFTAEVGFKNEISESHSGKEKRSARQAARHKFKLAFEQLTPPQMDTLWNHYLAQRGTLYAFAYYDYQSAEVFTVRYVKDSMSRETFLYDAEKTGIELIEVL